MNSFLLLLPALALLLSGSGCATTSSPPSGSSRGSALSGAELRALLSGQTFRVNGYGEQAELVYGSDGSVSGSNPQGEKNDGRWSINPEGQLCQQFKRWGHGDRICYTVYRQGEIYQEYTANGLLAYTLEATARRAAAPSAPPAAGRNETSPDKPALVADPETTKNDLRYLVRETAKNCPACNLSGAELAGADLSGANLAGTNLVEANLAGSNLRRANLEGANLTRANLRGAELKGANLEGANLTETDLTAANLSGVKGLPRQ